MLYSSTLFAGYTKNTEDHLMVSAAKIPGCCSIMQSGVSLHTWLYLQLKPLLYHHGKGYSWALAICRYVAPVSCTSCSVIGWHSSPCQIMDFGHMQRCRTSLIYISRTLIGRHSSPCLIMGLGHLQRCRTSLIYISYFDRSALLSMSNYGALAIYRDVGPVSYISRTLIGRHSSPCLIMGLGHFQRCGTSLIYIPYFDRSTLLSMSNHWPWPSSPCVIFYFFRGQSQEILGVLKCLITQTGGNHHFHCDETVSFCLLLPCFQSFWSSLMCGYTTIDEISWRSPANWQHVVFDICPISVFGVIHTQIPPLFVKCMK